MPDIYHNPAQSVSFSGVVTTSIIPPLGANNIVIYGSASYQSDDRSGPQGGAIDLATKIITTRVNLGVIEIYSDNPNDIGPTYLVTGIIRGGYIVQQTAVLNGVLPITLKEMSVMKVEKIGGAAILGEVTVRSGATIIGTLSIDTLTSTETTILRRLFCQAQGSRSFTKTYYEKVFIRNTHQYSTLTHINISESLDEENNVEFGFDPDINGNSTSASRLSRPKIVPASQFKSTPRVLPDLNPGEAIGMWVRIAVPEGQAHAVVV